MSNQDLPLHHRTQQQGCAPRPLSAFMSTMVLPMIDPNTPPYRFPGSGPGESEIWRIRENPETPLFSWPPSSEPPSSTRYHGRDHRTGQPREVLPPISTLFNPPHGYPLQPLPSLPANRPVLPPPGPIHPDTTQPVPTPPTTSVEPHGSPGKERLFHISVTLESERNIGSKVKPKIVPKKDRAIHPGEFEVLAPSFSRRDLIRIAYEALGASGSYMIGVETGPPATAYWAGTRGGPHSAVSITNDQQWAGFKNSLKDTPKSVVEIRMILKAQDLIPWKKSTAVTALSTSDDETEELGEGMGVPFVEQFGPEKRATANVITKLRAQWPCKKDLPNHSSCVDARGEHIQLTLPRLKDWAKIIRASDGQVKVDVPPPDDVLDQWSIGRNGLAPRPRGRCGPHPQSPNPHPGPGTDAAQLSLATAGLLTAITGSLTRKRSPSPQQPRKRTRDNPSPPQSPPPPTHAELHVFLDEFFHKIRRPGEMERVYDLLDREGYTPEALGDHRLDAERITNLTGLPSGAILSMQVIAREWCESNKVKRQNFRK